MKAIKKPVEIEFYPAEQQYLNEILAWSTKERPITLETSNIVGRKIYITTLEGVMTANEGDIIIKGVEGEVYPCRRDIFDKTYDYPLSQ